MHLINCVIVSLIAVIYRKSSAKIILYCSLCKVLSGLMSKEHKKRPDPSQERARP